MKKYQCIACGTVKESKESCTCPVCGYMMFPQPYERSEVMIREIRSLADKTIGQEIDVSTLDFGKLRNDIDRFPDFQTIGSKVHHPYYIGKLQIFQRKPVEPCIFLLKFFNPFVKLDAGVIT